MNDTAAPAALAVRESVAIANWTPSFAVGVDEAVAAVNAKREFFSRVMREDEHYGKIPGTGKDAKPTLLKPGAELLLANMGLRPELIDADVPTIDYGDEGHEGLIRYRRACKIYRQTGPGVHDKMLVAHAEGSCSSRETKYRWRNGQRLCPECGKPAIIKGKAEYGGGFICFAKKDGCGAKFKDNDTKITQQSVGKVPNPDLADVENTILKMADKRALVAATLLATGCSDMFTQDMEDAVQHDSGGHRDDVIDGEFTETRHAPPAEVRMPPSIDGDEASEIVHLCGLLDFDTARIEKAVSWTSAARVTDVANLTAGEAAKMRAYLKREIDKLPKAEPTAPAPDSAGDPLEVVYCPSCGAQRAPKANIEPHVEGCELASSGERV